MPFFEVPSFYGEREYLHPELEDNNWSLKTRINGLSNKEIDWQLLFYSILIYIGAFFIILCCVFGCASLVKKCKKKSNKTTRIVSTFPVDCTGGLLGFPDIDDSNRRTMYSKLPPSYDEVVNVPETTPLVR